MNACVVYFSRIGNTKRLVQAIAETTKVPIFEITTTVPSAITNSVEGASPAKETVAFYRKNA